MKLSTAISAAILGLTFSASAYADCTQTDRTGCYGDGCNYWGECFPEYPSDQGGYCDDPSNAQQPECWCPNNPDHVQCADWRNAQGLSLIVHPKQLDFKRPDVTLIVTNMGNRYRFLPLRTTSLG